MMKSMGRLASRIVVAGLVGASAGLLAHAGTGDPGVFGGPPEGMIVTRHFTGIWDQVDQESQGIALQVVEQLDDSRRAVAYWYTYGADRKPTWFIGVGDLLDDRIELELFESTDVGFMQDAMPDTDPVASIGTMTIAFESCQSGEVTFTTDDPAVGSGSFRIERLLEIMNTHCSGGISDDMHADALYGTQRIGLLPARQGVTGEGHALYTDFPAHMEFELEVEGLADGSYRLYVGGQDRGEFIVADGRGRIEFVSPAEDGRRLMNFDPRGFGIEIRDQSGVVLSSFDDLFEPDGHGHYGGAGPEGDGEHNFDCAVGPGMGGGMGPGMGPGMADCVDAGDFLEIEAELQNTGVLPGAEGEAEWEMSAHRVRFDVAVEEVPAGTYPLRVGGVEVGVIEAFVMHNGEVYGHLAFRDPELFGMGHLDFEPRGQRIEVLQGSSVILTVDFPAE